MTVGYPYNILGLIIGAVTTVGAAINVTREGGVCGFTLFWWSFLSSNFQVIYRTSLEDPPSNPPYILLIYFNYSPLPLTQESTSMLYMIKNMMITTTMQWLMLMGQIQDSI